MTSAVELASVGVDLDRVHDGQRDLLGGGLVPGGRCDGERRGFDIVGRGPGDRAARGVKSEPLGKAPGADRPARDARAGQLGGVGLTGLR